MATIRKRGGKWQVQVRRKGHCPLSKSFLSRKDAEIWGRQTEQQADRGELLGDQRRLKQFTLGELVSRYRDTVTPRKRSAIVETIVLNAFLKHPICQKRLSELSPKDFAEYRDERLQAVKPNSLKRLLSPIQNLFEVAKDEWNIPLKDNPISKLVINCTSNRRERRLRPGEQERLIEAARKGQNALMLPIMMLALETGMRRSELLNIRLQDVDWHSRLLSVPMSKNGHSRKVPLTMAAYALLRDLTQASGGEGSLRVFQLTANAFRLAWERLKRRANIDDLHFHDLRHEAISRFFEMALTVPEVASISGHRDPRMLFRYAHACHRRVLEIVDAADAKKTATMAASTPHLKCQ